MTSRVPELPTSPAEAGTRTTTSRLDIGFDFESGDWARARAIYTDGALEILGHPVMEDWETPYMARLARVATSRGGRVLEVGFGMGISASMVQRFDIEEHVIIEANLEVFERLRAFAETAARPVTPRVGFWQEVVPTLADESFDGILFDTYPLTSAEIHTNHFPFLCHAHRLLRPGGVLTYYADESHGFSKAHRRALIDAGFSHIEGSLCPVTPPPDCLYWDREQMLVPIVLKT